MMAKINLMTDAPFHNLALMKLSSYHKQLGDEVYLNMPLIMADKTYVSALFDKSVFPKADEYGGPAIQWSCLPQEIETCKPDYSLFKTGYSLGYTFRPCYRGCDFCKVSTMKHPDEVHHSIWDFHDERFKIICLLNNNTFYDPLWEDTFGEIWEANLAVFDENGYDLRLLDDRKTNALKRTRWIGDIHFAFDRPEDSKQVMKGLALLNDYKIRNVRVYVLIGFSSTIDEDLWRCQVIKDYGYAPYIMPYVRNEANRRFKRFIDTFMWRKYMTIKQAWSVYHG